jgi:hypothetical protein
MNTTAARKRNSLPESERLAAVRVERLVRHSEADDDRYLTTEEYNFRLNLRICITHSWGIYYNAFVDLHPFCTDPAWKTFDKPVQRQLEFQMPNAELSDAGGH